MIVNLTLLIEDIDREWVDYELISEESGNTYIWTKKEEYPVGPDYDVKIVTDIEMKKIFDIKVGNLIISSEKEIRDTFLEALFELDVRKQEDEIDGFEHIHEEHVQKVSIDTDPYDPKLIRVETKPFGISYVEELIETGDIDISPDFQREFVWTDITRKSRLIESLMLRIPLPVFYLSQDEDGLFKVVDGIQRLTVIHSFLNNEFKLKNLEYLKELEGKWFKNRSRPDKDSLPSMYVRRIEQTQLFFNIIDPQAPEKVKYDIFKRINTGGKSLNAQEIRNCLSNKSTRDMLKKMVKLPSFLDATKGSISSTRMADKEIALRFIAFYLFDNRLFIKKEYKSQMDDFLDETVDILNKMQEEDKENIINEFDKAMKNAFILFGTRAFRKANFINKSLFLSMSRVLYKYNTIIVSKMELGNIVLERLQKEIKENEEYNKALSMATNDARHLLITYNVAKKIMGEFIND